MGKLNDLLIDLEDQGVVVWNEELRTYTYSNKYSKEIQVDPGKPFDLTEYMRKSGKGNKNV